MPTIKSEKTVWNSLKRTVEAELHGWLIKLPTIHITGLPDGMSLLPGGVIIFVETKRKGKTPTNIQTLVHNKLRALGFRVEVADTAEQIKEIFKTYKP